MAKEVITRLIDDITGDAVPEGEGESVTFSVGGKVYELDLNSKNAAKFHETMKFYVDHGSEVGAAPSALAPTARKTASRAATKSTKRDPEQLQKIRDWANSHGYEVAPRGRIKADIEAAYHAAGGK
jgi:hypothetical protein